MSKFNPHDYEVGARVRYIERVNGRGIEGTIVWALTPNVNYRSIQIDWDRGFGPNGFSNPDRWDAMAGIFEIIPNIDWSEYLELE